MFFFRCLKFLTFDFSDDVFIGEGCVTRIAVVEGIVLGRHGRFQRKRARSQNCLNVVHLEAILFTTFSLLACGAMGKEMPSCLVMWLNSYVQCRVCSQKDERNCDPKVWSWWHSGIWRAVLMHTLHWGCGRAPNKSAIHSRLGFFIRFPAPGQFVFVRGLVRVFFSESDHCWHNGLILIFFSLLTVLISISSGIPNHSASIQVLICN